MRLLLQGKICISSCGYAKLQDAYAYLGNAALGVCNRRAEIPQWVYQTELYADASGARAIARDSIYRRGMGNIS